MPVFIFHTSIDKDKTCEIHEFLTARQVICYMDMFDPELQFADDITDYNAQNRAM